MKLAALFLASTLFSITAFSADLPPKPSCGQGYLGPHKVFLTRYVSKKKGDPQSIEKGKFCDKWGGQDLPAKGTDKPSDHRWGANPKDGWVMVAIPQNASFFGQNMKLLGSKQYEGVKFRAMDRIGTPDRNRQPGPVGQLDISTNCDGLKRGVNEFAWVCVEDPKAPKAVEAKPSKPVPAPEKSPPPQPKAPEGPANSGVAQ